jgi:FMN phosphatase YigB (HAD superfamily)
MKRRVVFWDLGNVLFKFRIADFLKAVIAAGHQEAVCQRELDEIITRSFHGALSLSGTIDELVNVTRCRESAVMEIMEQDWVIPNRELMECVRRFSSECHQGIISDLWQVPFFWIRRDYERFLSIFDYDKMFFSNLVGSTKTESGDNNLVRAAICMSGLQPSHTCMIDDDVNVIQVASGVGMHTIHFPESRLAEKRAGWKVSNEVVVAKLRKEFLDL